MFKMLVVALFLVIPAFTHSVVDMRGVSVQIPNNLERIATISDGFVEGVMTHLGEISKVSAIASWSLKRDYKYSFTTINGETYTKSGLNTMRYLHPFLDKLPCFNSAQGDILNFETLASANVQLVIMRVGDCTVSGGSSARGGNLKGLERTISMIESLGIPLVVLYSPTYYGKAELSSIREEMRVLGEIFGKKEQALALYDYLNEVEILVKNRTQNITQKPSVLYFGLSSIARKSGGAGFVSGTKTPESYIIENIVNAKNAFRGNASRAILSGEQVYAINPDVILLPTQNGYHPKEELLSAPYYANLQGLKAVQEGRVYPLPWTPMNCARRVEYPLDILIIAKASYPKQFEDIKIHSFALDFYQKVYNVSLDEAKELRKTQLLDWTLDYDF